MDEPTGLSGDVLRLVLLWSLNWFIGYGFGFIILKPLRDVALKPPPPTQYRLPDLFVLLGVIFLAGLPFAFRTPSEPRRAFLGLLLIWSLCAAWWWGGLRLLSRAGIQQRCRRTVCLGVAVPLVCAGPPLWLVLPIMFSPERPWLVAVWLCGWPIISIGGRGLALWIAKGAQSAAGPTAKPPSA
jgi:hypothetical protein